MSRLDGTGRSNFITSGVVKPLGMAIDYSNDRLYWVDDDLDTIEHVDIETGLNRVTRSLLRWYAIYKPRLSGLALYKVSLRYIMFL